ncbi:MAG: DUF1672 domain-containing protein, partial [Staphylococcus epidermidis]|nr:DUF1672 domain-containing protein [Staphylococcus epidermidis]
REEYEKLGEQFFKDNFSLNVKATNVVGSGDGAEVYVHCDDHDIVFNASIPFDMESIHEEGSMRSNDNGDTMSMMVGTVLSGFEYRANKEKMDNLEKYLKDKEDKYHYTGFTDEAITKTQNIGYQNNYFYITTSSTKLRDYRKHFEPLIKESDDDFKKHMKQLKSKKDTYINTEITTTLFSTLDEYDEKIIRKNTLSMAKEMRKEPSIPHNFTFHLLFSNNKLKINDPNISNNQINEYRVFDHDGFKN